MTRGFARKNTIVAFAGIVLVSALALVGCAPKESVDGGPGAPASERTQAVSGDFSFSMDSDCSICHTKPAESTADSNCLLGNENHATLTCSTCHSDEGALSSAHDGVAYGDSEPKRLKTTEVDDGICQTCHGSYEELAEKTTDCTVLTDSKGTVVNPHSVKSLNDDHESITCTSCHEAHGGDSVVETAPSACTSCHHTNVYECYTCHD